MHCKVSILFSNSFHVLLPPKFQDFTFLISRYDQYIFAFSLFTRVNGFSGGRKFPGTPTRKLGIQEIERGDELQPVYIHRNFVTRYS